ncbi:Hsp90 co-chaperone Cdc37, N-terminally processed like [Quillaja saponaria]|uniref:Hsp90 co-chaperone Cdc37, N-terminally processed like n=1 Tax=Quillaja saponaria TaxID=32244 RepID=A0AAD7VHH8_QUISA|nr:Hsp90 co-chaperone Cdc37, N-terminally processed like [Quillaja saponaria]
MKASLKFREEQKPLFRAKVPISILGLPFQSGIVAGASKELTLNLATFFKSGPSAKVSYRPNDSSNPFSLIVKTGTGPYGSPNSSAMMMSAEFNLLARGNGSPVFMLHFKPRFGDFSLKKSQSSVFDKRVLKSSNGVASDDDGSIEVVESPVINGYGSFSGNKLSILSESPAASAISDLFSGMEVAATTTMPVRGRAVVNFRWGVRPPFELKSRDNTKTGIAFQRIPFLVMNKIGIEHAEGGDLKGNRKAVPELAFPGNSEVAEACFSVKRQLEVLQVENGLLRTAVDDLRREIGGVRSTSPGRGSDSGKYREVEKNGTKPTNGRTDRRTNEKKSSEFNGFPGKLTEGDVKEELKKR